ncbi:anti-sigma factor [Pseudokineococcus marinus]|uniref:Regulator of SigK n=1 Tax=Pseudokineococcus marinus TaxID=351215 RepID=A0A849BNE5_9ACTN|nr:anti-sigma factor [Pseudokineococcus marinus]NNH22567.1 anti-sigma factor [Pseudokineococcus marinus]
MAATDHRTGDRDDVRDLLAAHALDAVDDVERARVERLLREDPEAAAESAGYAEAASRMAVAVAATPPPRLRASVLAEVSRTQQVAPAPPTRREAAADRRGGRGAVRLLAAACGVLLAGCVGLGAVVLGQDDGSPSLVAAGGFADGTAALLEVDGDYVVLGQGVAAPPAGRVYQLWSLGDDGVPVPEGFLEPEDGGFVGQLDDWRDGAVLAITEEPAGGSEQPTSDILATVAT